MEEILEINKNREDLSKRRQLTQIEEIQEIVTNGLASGLTASDFRALLDKLEIIFIRDKRYYPQAGEAANAFIGGQAEAIRFIRTQCGKL